MKNIKVIHFKKMVFVIGVILLVLFLALLIGRVLGNFYLVNITQQNHVDINENNDVQKSVKKTKALRLEEVDYYSILVLSSDRQELAVSIEKEMGEKDFPVVVTSEAPYKILLGFLSNEDNLISLASRIKVGETEAKVIHGKLNEFSFKFFADDTYAEEKIAPFLGRISLCLEKGLLLYTSLSVNDNDIIRNRPKFLNLAASLEKLYGEGQDITDEKYKDMQALSEKSLHWAESIRQLEKDWTDKALLISQQKALALLEEYRCFLRRKYWG
ncbi:MAG: hypothetical protein PHI90_01250 [Clostridia bacterium]|nr:hypothetical protein [Clostridia bacterium]MDD4047451.1 hypothetical protein [Clostridia bacterium]